MKIKSKLITIPLLGIPFVLALGDEDVEECMLIIAKKYKMHKNIIDAIRKDDLDTPAGGCCVFDLYHGIGILWFPTKTPTLGVQSHEITHLVDYIQQYIGAETEMEFRAYLDEWLTDELPKQLKSK